MSEERSSYQPHIDGLRAVAVLAVLLFHLEVPGFGGGFVGVDVFFVISGYLITGLLRREIEGTGTLRMRDFYLRRARRLAPALVVTVVATLAVGAFLLTPAALRELGAEATTALLSVSNIHFWLGADYFDAAARTKPLLHTWSLGVEEQFYFVAPAALLLLLRGRARRWALPALLLVAAASLAANIPFGRGIGGGIGVMGAGFQNGKSTIFYLLPFRVFELGIGGALCWAGALRPRRGWVADLALVAGLAMIALATATYGSAMRFPSYWALLPCLGTALVLHAGAQSRLAPLLTNRAAVGIGLGSYSLYLVHWPVIVYWSWLARALGPAEQVGAALLSGALAYLSWRFVERPFRERRLRLRWLALPAAAAMAVGAHMWATGGWGWRTPGAAPANAAPAAAQDLAVYGGEGYRGWPEEKPAGDPDFLVIGDSHGLQYGEGMQHALALPSGLRFQVVAGTSCLHLPGVLRNTGERDWVAMRDKSLERVAQALRACRRQPVVILSHSWLSQMRDARLEDGRGGLLPDKIDAQEVVRGLVRLRDALGIERLVVVGQTPMTNGLHLVEELARPAMARQETMEQLRAPRPLRDDIRDFNAVLAQGAAHTGAYEFLDPTQALCADGMCDCFDAQGTPLYSDTSHLSRAGSRRVIAFFAPRLLELARRPSP
ncbi:MAG: acyltransferase family protein [Phycisphaerales bacterium]